MHERAVSDPGDQAACVFLAALAVADVHPSLDHPIFSESLRLIRLALDQRGDTAWHQWPEPEQDVLLRLIHSSGDLSVATDLRFSSGACDAGMQALASGAAILTDTAMAAAAVASMARRTFANSVHSVLDWAPAVAPAGGTRAASGMRLALQEHPKAVVLIGSAPTALEQLLDQLDGGDVAPALVIGMPVGFVGVAQSKQRLLGSAVAQICLQGSRGGAAMVGAALNALLRRAWLNRANCSHGL
jgi:precorrin-8X/cobalt-precorrin-8 methylmutase